MNTDKRIFTPLLLAVAIFALAACGSGEQSEAPAAPEPPAAAEPAAPPPAAEAPEPAAAPAEEADVPDGDDAEVIANFRASDTVAPFFDNSYGFAVFPTIGKGGLIVGGAHGEGRVYVGDTVTGTTTVTQASIGLQAGGQAFSQIVFFENQAAYDSFTSGNFEFDAKAEAVAIKAGASAQTSTVGSTAGAGGDSGEGAGGQAAATYRKGTAIFTYAKGGLMAGAAVGGQKFKFEAM